MRAIFQVSEILFFWGFECVLVQDFLMQTLSACYFISEGRLSYPLSVDMIILCVGYIDLEL